MSGTDIESAKLDIAEILMDLVNSDSCSVLVTDPSDEQAYAEICSSAEGWLEDFMEYCRQQGAWEVKS